ncbi:iron-sulfur cluster assembly 1 homolog, mitochondrial [Rhopalosiphum padi]|uniref:iron-sulfur cluster assembly 1 homolog, mitochondrial n=1 Tax=Rhopalosiphum padi TaxID=40932 RepID=UPI00298D9939|nr:iron-sulfur cluster assembly 1 homolog, mitochondrial [Rhopalosiphum padi]
MAGRIVSASIRAVAGSRKPIKAALTLTPSAVDQLKKILSGKSDCIALKIGVKQRGCNGLSYTLDYASEKHKLDEEVVQDGIRVFIDRKAQLTLLGTEMDFVQSKLSSEFVFYNPNIKGTCGCGESFNI